MTQLFLEQISSTSIKLPKDLEGAVSKIQEAIDNGDTEKSALEKVAKDEGISPVEMGSIYRKYMKWLTKYKNGTLPSPKTKIKSRYKKFTKSYVSRTAREVSLMLRNGTLYEYVVKEAIRMGKHVYDPADVDKMCTRVMELNTNDNKPHEVAAIVVDEWFNS